MRFSLEHGMVVRRIGACGAGGADVPRLVWVHGLGEASVNFDPVVAAIPEVHHVLVDLPGYGRAPWPDRPPSLEAVAETLVRWLASGPSSIVLGHSMGGVLATLVAERSPTVRGIVDIEGNLSRGDCTFSLAATAYTLAEFCAHGFAALRAKVYADGVAHAPLRGYHAAMSFASPVVFHHHALELVELSSGGALAPRLAALRVPKLYAAGVPDGICAASRTLLDEHEIRWIALEPGGHWAHLDQLAPFVAALRAFVAGL
jgi:pimeloyl-ACP methyl ester carboxylesterase